MPLRHALQHRGVSAAVAIGLLVLTAASSPAVAGGTGDGPTHRQPWNDWDRVLAYLVAGGDSLPPPPAPLQPYLRHFVHLYIGYQSIAADHRPPFAVWLVMHGVTDPVSHRAMMGLYHWVELATTRNSR